MVIGTPATVTVPVRTVPMLFATVKVTLPLPVPESGATVIQLESLDAVQPHPPGLLRLIVPVPPTAAN
jgi:hypothetical protein